jgi:hypothetical protein
MQSTGAQRVMKAAAEDRSYAGPFAYESQVPFKVFAGDVPCVPLPTVVDALEHNNGGGGGALSPRDIASLRKVIGMDVASCSTRCSPQLHECIGSAPGKNLSDKMSDSTAQACMKQSLACYQTCIANAPGAT